MKLVNNIVDLVGQTPVVRLNRLVDKNSATIYLKLESFNPASSVKDRAALNMVEDAERKGLLREGSTIIEATSGNTGIGIAMVAAAKGYKAIIVMPANATPERVKLIRAYGAQVILTPREEMMKGSIKKAEELLARIANSFMPRQFENMANPEIHKRTTGLEILKQMDGKLDAFVATAGTGGTISGVGEILRDQLPDIKIYVVEPKNSPVIAGGQPAPHKIVGTGPGFIPNTLNTKIFDKIIHVRDEDAIETSRSLAQKEGILCGISAGASAFAAIEIGRELGPGKKVLSIVADTGERYLSMDLL